MIEERSLGIRADLWDLVVFSLVKFWRKILDIWHCLRRDEGEGWVLFDRFWRILFSNSEFDSKPSEGLHRVYFEGSMIVIFELVV